jgi:DNA primase
MRLSSEQRLLLEKSTATYEANVDRAARYLAGRGFTEATARSFRFGVVPDEPLPGDEVYRGRLSIPYLTRSGVVSLRYRCIATHDHDSECGAKYLGYPGAGTHLFNVGDLFGDGKFIGITEGELDSVVLHSLGIPATGVPGASNWKPHFSRIFEDYGTVYVFADGDNAGKKFADKVAGELDSAVVLTMPDGMDVNEVYLHPDYGPKWLLDKVGMSQ